MRRLLYVTIDGLLQPLGYSQVFRIVEGLARRGVPYAVVSMERTEDLASEARVRELEHRLEAVGVDWVRLPYEQGRLSNTGRLAAAALARVRRGDIGLVHARSYHGAAVAYAARTALRVPYLFDTRSYWIDERAEAGQWFRRPAVLGAARFAERRLYRGASAIVTLTELQAYDLGAGRFGELGGRPRVVIPTCADFAEFRAREQKGIAPELAAFAGNSLVVGFVGSVNASYRTDRAAALVKRILAARPDAKIVALGADPGAYRRFFDEAGVGGDRVLAKRVEHDRIAEWVAGLDWGMLMLGTSFAKRASMPTKLAEFFAAGVRPVHHGCNEEVAAWIAKTGTGLTLADLDDAHLARAAATIAASTRDAAALERARAVAYDHFSVESALTRYEALVRSLA